MDVNKDSLKDVVGFLLSTGRAYKLKVFGDKIFISQDDFKLNGPLVKSYAGN